MVIRNAQMAAMQRSLNRRFAFRIAPDIRKDYPGETRRLDDIRLADRIEEAVGRARGYGFREDRDVIAFVELTFVVGEGFDALPRFRAILDDRRLSPSAQMDMLMECAAAEGAAAPGFD